MTYRIPLFGALLLATLSPAALAQWSSDPATNLAVADGSATQVQPKAAPTADGGVYISWYQGAGFDVRLQKLDAGGNALFPEEGILIADRGFSSTQDYGLDVDAAGNALLTFRDDRNGGVDITATLVTPAGTQPWGPTGVQLTRTTDFVAAPKITGTSDGGSVVAWSQNADTHLQKLDASGAPQWTDDVVLAPPTGFYFTSDLHAAGTGAILSVHHQTGSFSSPRFLLAQKFDGDGHALWGTEPLAVFDGGSLQIGNFPTFVPDGSGGAVFSWYSVSAGLEAYVQRILSDGTEAFAPNGLVVSTNGSRERVAPNVAFDSATEDLYVFWVELANAQSLQGIYGQKFDASGSRRWTDEGIAIEALANVGISSVQTVVGGAGAFAFWDSAPGFGQDQLFGANASGDASSTIEVVEFDVSTTPSSKSRLAAVNNTEGFEVVVWQDSRAGNDDIYAQNVNSDGTLGVPAVTIQLASTGGVPVIPAEGGSFSFSAIVTNTTSKTQTVQAWTQATFPDGSVKQPDGQNDLLGPITVTIAPGQTLARQLIQEVPAGIPAGDYVYTGLVGAFPDGEVASDGFPGVKLPPTGARTAAAVTAWRVLDARSGSPIEAGARWSADTAEAPTRASSATPEAFALASAYPNPFASRTTIGYDLPQTARVDLTVYDVVGRRVATLVSEEQAAGRYRVEWATSALPSGTYFYRIAAGSFHETRKLVLVR